MILGMCCYKKVFADPVLDVDYYTLTYRDKNRLIAELQTSGMLSAESEIGDLSTVTAAEDGAWPVTYEVIYAHAFTPAEREEVSASADGVVRVPISHLKRQLSQGKEK